MRVCARKRVRAQTGRRNTNLFALFRAIKQGSFVPVPLRDGGDGGDGKAGGFSSELVGLVHALLNRDPLQVGGCAGVW